jgi:hypothetical protein
MRRTDQLMPVVLTVAIAMVMGAIFYVALNIRDEFDAALSAKVAAQAEHPEPAAHHGSVTRIYSEAISNTWVSVYHINSACFAVWLHVNGLTSQPVPCPWDVK